MSNSIYQNFEELLEAAKRLRSTQKSYMAARSDPGYDPEVKEYLGRNVAEAAADLDEVIERIQSQYLEY